MLSEIISLISVIIALTAVSVSAWQARSNALSARHSHSLPVITEMIGQFRSREFRESIIRLVESPDHAKPHRGFESLPKDLREDAYRVCFFFDYAGLLVALGIISETIIIGVMGTHVVRVWSAIWPAIESERSYRNRTYPADVSPGFLVYYEHLVARIHELGGGRNAAIALQRRVGVRKLPDGSKQ